MKKFNKKKVVTDIRTIIFRNFKVKIICFLLAIAMYIAISWLQQSPKTYSTELKVENLRDYLVISTNLPETVKITVREKPNVFDKITEEDFNIRLDLKDVTGPVINKKIKLTWDIPKDMKSFFGIVNVHPKEIEINVEKLVEKNVTILLNLIGKPAPGFIVKRTTINPSVIRIQGPRSIIDLVNSINTETINIEGVKESFGRQVNLVSENPNIKALGKVNVFFEVIEETDVKDFRFQRIYFENLKKQFRAKIKKPIIIKLEGPKNEITTLTMDDIYLYADCSGVVYPGEYPLEVKFKIPENFKVISIFPQRISVTVSDRN